ncbi:transmembrane protein 268 [Solea solea]|uniref:transmembrane protein 268 n=1 Tax=Solea solea TaxID=90069 RepID=UPI00272A6542|nr:transmembrane protein 268 [Solea solea]
MEDKDRVCPVMEENEVDVQIRQSKSQPQACTNTATWSNGQCILSVSSCSALNPRFNLSLCRAKLESDGFQIPVTDLEAPLRTALELPSVRRYMVFNSAFFHFIMAPVLYMVVWCSVFSTLHIYMPVSDGWVLCLCVSLVSILFTTAIIFILHCNNKKINMNLDVRLIQVNERMVKHKVLVAVTDWVQNCSGNMQLYFVYWDMSLCVRALTEALEEHSFVENDIQNILRKKMSHLTLTTEVKVTNPEAGVSDAEQQDSEEHRPLLGQEVTGGSTSSSQQEAAKVTTSCSLIPDASLPPHAKAYQLLMTYSAAYVKLLVSNRLSAVSHHHHRRSQRSHCTVAPLCLCQFIRNKILR